MIKKNAKITPLCIHLYGIRKRVGRFPFNDEHSLNRNNDMFEIYVFISFIFFLLNFDKEKSIHIIFPFIALVKRKLIRD